MKNALQISHEIIKCYLKDGDIAVDATSGNGNDTLYLAELVGDKGKVYAFDIQKVAINTTLEKLKKNKLEERVELINDGHQYMDDYISSEVQVIVFNLGYLPGGDHNIGTKPESTIQAIDKSLELLKVGGIVMMVIYYGGDSGFTEKAAVLDYIEKLDYKKYTVLMMNYANWINNPPIAVCIEKVAY